MIATIPILSTLMICVSTITFCPHLCTGGQAEAVPPESPHDAHLLCLCAALAYEDPAVITTVISRQALLYSILTHILHHEWVQRSAGLLLGETVTIWADECKAAYPAEPDLR